MSHSNYDYRVYPKTLAPDDFWRQVRRTVNGNPVSEEQISLIADAIRRGLQFQKNDILLDFACGNGALTRYFYEDCHYILGVDASDYLIEIANRYFTLDGKADYIVDDAEHYASNEPSPLRFTKVLCYGSFPFFSYSDAHTFLDTLNRRFSNVERVFIGNLPDPARAHKFYPPGRDYAAELSDVGAPIGIWRSQRELEELAERTGWKLELTIMPESFYAAHYRYDALLLRKD